MMYYCYVEAVNLDTIFRDCQDLSTVRGGGLAVLNIGADVHQRLSLPPKDLITNGASQGLLKIDGDHPDSVRRRVEDILPQLNLGRYATILLSIRAVPAEAADFRSTLASMKSEIRWQQMKTPSVVYPPMTDDGICKIDRLRPGRARGIEPSLQSDFTFERRELGRDQKHVLLRDILEQLGPPRFRAVNDLAELSAAPANYDGNLKGKIAILRFDGNSFGKIVNSCASEEEFGEFSRLIRDQQERYFRRLLDTRGQYGGDRWWEGNRLRCEVLVYGGDEVTLVAPAWLGWDALACFYDDDNPFPVFKGEAVTYSGGIVFAHMNAPIHSLRDLASGLADEAKRRAPSGQKGNFVAYQVLESFDSVGSDLEAFLDRRFAFSGKEGILLDAAFITALRDNMKWWRSAVSRRQLHKFVRELTKGSAMEEEDYKALAERATTAEKIAEDLSKQAQINPAALLHLLELWDYVDAEVSEEVPV